MASAGIVTLVPAKRNDNYTVLHRDYPRFAREYGRSLDVLRGISGVDPAKTGIYAESEGTRIATILTSKRQDIAFAILTSAPVFNGREQMAMAVSAYTHEAGAPKPVVKDMAKLMSLDYAPFDLAYADFDADRYLKSLTMPVLVNYGTYDTAMPIEQGRSGSSPRPTSPATRTSPYAISPATIRCGLVRAYSPRTCHWPKAIRKRWKIG